MVIKNGVATQSTMFFYKMIFQVILVCFAVLCGSGKASKEEKPKSKPQPYSFGYTIKAKEGIQHRQEEGDGKGKVKGNYGFLDNKGIHRIVNYIADDNGFKAQIKTNEPGTAGDSPASVKLLSNDPYAHGAARPYTSKVNVPYVPALEESDGKKGLPTVKDFHKYKIGRKDGGRKPYGPDYVGGLAHSNILGAGYKKLGEIVYFGANLVGGKITGHDSRFKGK